MSTREVLRFGVIPSVILGALIGLNLQEATAFDVVVPYSGQLAVDGQVSFQAGSSILLIAGGDAGDTVTGSVRYDTTATPIIVNPTTTRFDINQPDALAFNINTFNVRADTAEITRTRPGNGTDTYVWRYVPDPFNPPTVDSFTLASDEFFLEITIQRPESAGDGLPEFWPPAFVLGGDAVLRDAGFNRLTVELIQIPEPALMLPLLGAACLVWWRGASDRA